MESTTQAWGAVDEFLSDLAVLEELFTSDSDVVAAENPISTPEPPCTLKTAQASTKTAGKKRMRHPIKVQALKIEIKTLRTHLRRLHEHQQLLSPRARVSWRQRAVTSRIARQKAQREARSLRQIITESQQLVDNAKLLVAFQKELLPAAPKAQTVLLVDDDTRILSSLKANLDARCGQLESSVDRSRLHTLAMKRLLYPSRKVDLWTPFVHQQGAGVSFEATEVIPFDVMMIWKAAARYIHLDANAGSSSLIFDQIRRNRQPRDVNSSSSAIDQASNGKEQEGRMILRVIANDRETMLLWEHTFYWLANEDIQVPSKRVLIRDSGFSLIMPCPDFDGSASIVHWSSSKSMHAADGSVLKPSDPRVRRIAKSCQSWFDVHVRSVENKLMESKIGTE